MDIDAHRATLDAWLILQRTPGIGAATLRTLIAQHGNIEQALNALRRDAGTLGAASRDWLRAPDERLLAMDRAWLAQPGHTLLTFDSEDFPALLEEIPSPPAALFVAGDVSALWRPQIAIVGSRNASQAGAANAGAFARALTRAGFAIISGLAEGIDAAAHVAALEAGGLTVAVLGTGPDLVYPAKHRDLTARIARQGALVSEFSPGTPGRSMHFPRRNRIIAGLALGTLVVEAGLRSGSLITAREASESGREVFALPGSIHNPLARGCHRLIRNGAKLVETADEIVAELAPLAHRLGASLRERLQETPAADAEPAAAPSRAAHAEDPDYARLLAALGHDALGIDELSARTAIPVAALSSMLLMLELEGEVMPTQGGYARRVGT
jgi:DNA processing protein